MDKTVSLTVWQWEMIDMAIDIAIKRSTEYGSPESAAKFADLQQEVRGKTGIDGPFPQPGRTTSEERADG